MAKILLSLTLASVVQCYVVCVANATILNITSDQSALLALKACISDEPHNPLTNNWSTSTSVCNWIGVTCGSKHHRVIALNLSYMSLTGTIPPHIGNLSFLVWLRARNNSFWGSVPNELTRLYRLKRLDFSFNHFNGEIPSSLGLLSRLQFLSLQGNGFTGTIPASLSNISSLQIIYLGFNTLTGFIPSSIFNLSSLQKISLPENKLSGPMPSIFFDMPSLQIISLTTNQLSGALPGDMFHHLPNLQALDVSSNQLSGKVPSTLFKCIQLFFLGLWENNFQGRLPPEIGNLTMLAKLYLEGNNFGGAIPSEIGNLRNLDFFGIDRNNFTGSIPYEIFNISSLQVISMPVNKLSGQLPSNIGLFLPNLQVLYVGDNELSGTIPNSISNASQLIGLDLSSNLFSGSIPKTIGNLRLLHVINLSNNNLRAELASLFSSLSNCQYFREIILSTTLLSGILPSSLGNLSASLQQFYLEDCSISGRIPSNIGNLSNLILLALDGTALAGPIPNTMERLRKLQYLDISRNTLEGPIPSDLCQLKSLFYLSLRSNKLSGQIPPCISNLTLLRELYLGFNQLSSVVPLSLWSLTDIQVVNLSSNFLSGSLSFHIGDMKVLRILDLSRNKVSGVIPPTIGGLQELVNLSLEDNRLEGSIPESLGKMVSLEYLDLSNNELYGEIPKSLEALFYLRFLNVSFNKLRGKIPTGGSFVNFSASSFMSNDALCGAPRLQVPPCKEASRPRQVTKVHILRYVLPTIGLLILGVSIVLFFTKCQNIRNTESSSEVELPPLAKWRIISHQELQRATEGFNANNLIGEGSFGSVYKGTLSDEGAFPRFDAECEVLRNIRHRNLIKIISACSNMDFKAFVLEYMPNGNLDMWLHFDNRFLTLLQRLNIMIDMAAALEYLHFGNATPIVHCDLKPNNVLLDEDMVAHVADFGIAKLLGDADSVTQTMTLATIGYMAPDLPEQRINMTDILVRLHKVKLKFLRDVEGGNKQVSGVIPPTIGGLQELVNLSLEDNRLEGSIPESLGKMVSLEYLELYGEIPKSLEALFYLRFLNVSFNKLRGKIPKEASLIIQKCRLCLKCTYNTGSTNAPNSINQECNRRVQCKQFDWRRELWIRLPRNSFRWY
ncbi:LRR receptor-like serine/threonine-protein kinase FLS2 [Morella rubra]|uniref:LRR receptor-like serine/threonine-protein kinase FLS2 n=1 Tax=Morella rubra TaxID=262757 RepID=A0A6A1UQ30_9ROSI|nr:LRR receptor-like serine/threonine-protein kinase FLS2 [Morella rubra]